MNAPDPKLPEPANQAMPSGAESEPLFSAEWRATLRRELGPDPESRARVRAALQSNMAAGMLTPAAQRVDALVHGHAAGVAGAKAATVTSLHALSAKLVVLSLVVAGGTTAVVVGRSAAPAPVAKAPVAVSDQQVQLPTTPQALEVAAKPDLQEHATAAEQPGATEGAHGMQQPTAATARESSAEPTLQPKAAARHTERGAVNRHAPAIPPLAAAASRRSSADPQAYVAAKPPQVAPAQLGSPSDVAAETPALATEPAAASVPTQAAASAQPSAPAHELAAELTLLRAASEALQQGNAGGALATLRRYSQQFPQGEMHVEAKALRAIALCASHATTAAQASDSFLREHPSSPLAERVRAACTPL